MPLKDSDELQKGQRYTFVFEYGRSIESDDSIKKKLSETNLKLFGKIISVSRSLLSGRDLIVVQPVKKTTLDKWKIFFSLYWPEIGYENVTFIEATEGEGQSKSGGIAEILPKIGSAVGSSIKTIGEASGATVGSVLGSALRPLAPYLIFVAGILLFLEYRRGKG